MSLIQDDYECEVCGERQIRFRDDPDLVCCGRELTRVFLRLNTDIWGAPRVYHEVDSNRAFSSHRELVKAHKAAGFEPCGDKEHGARPEDHRNLGKIFSYEGAPTRSVMHVRSSSGSR